MSEPDPTSAPVSDPAPAGGEGEAQALIRRQLAMLGRLAEAGLNIALVIERQVMAAEAAAPDAPPAPLGDLALAYGRVSRAVRLAVALQTRLLKDLQELDEAAVRRRRGAAAEAARDRQAREAARKTRVERIVGRLICEAFSDQADVDRLAEDLYERLDDDDIYGVLLDRPVSEIIELICRDLGIAPDWSRLAQEAWAEEEIRSGAAGAPLSGLRRLEPPAAAEPRPPDPGLATSRLDELRAAELRARSP